MGSENFWWFSLLLNLFSFQISDYSPNKRDTQSFGPRYNFEYKSLISGANFFNLIALIIEVRIISFTKTIMGIKIFSIYHHQTQKTLLLRDNPIKIHAFS